MDKLYIVMPAYNEEKNIENTVKGWYPLLNMAGDDSRLIVADSGSTDDTHSILLELKSRLPRLEILENTATQHGPKLIALYKYAIDNRADYVFQTDSDGQTSPEEFASFWNMRETCDAIIGIRSVRGDGQIRKFVEDTVCFLLKIIFGVKVKDANAPYRLMTCTLVSKYIGRFDPLYNLPNIMLVVFFEHYQEKVEYREISFSARRNGRNSLNLIRIARIGLKAIGDFCGFKRIM